MIARGFPGKRVDPNLAGMTARIRGLFSLTICQKSKVARLRRIGFIFAPEKDCIVMKMYLPLVTLLFFYFTHNGVAQESVEPLRLLSSRDSLLLRVDSGKKYVLHPVKPKQTLFSIARFYNLSLEELIENNTNLRDEPTLKTGTQLSIPTPNKAIRRYKGTGFKSADFSSIYYVVQPGDNLYQICKRYFDMPVDSIAKRNRLKDNNIKPGQRLHVGWMGTEGIHADWRPTIAGTALVTLKERFLNDQQEHHVIEGQGVCFWQKNSKEKGDLYALHRDAAIGTIISVTNPMSNRTVYAKVIARVPDG
jgi:LysM repeat protein